MAETHFRLARISLAKIETMRRSQFQTVKRTRIFLNPEQRLAFAVMMCLDELRRLDRYEERALSRFSRALRHLNG
jgi:hypothetical protein